MKPQTHSQTDVFNAVENVIDLLLTFHTKSHTELVRQIKLFQRSDSEALNLETYKQPRKNDKTSLSFVAKNDFKSVDSAMESMTVSEKSKLSSDSKEKLPKKDYRPAYKAKTSSHVDILLFQPDFRNIEEEMNVIFEAFPTFSDHCTLHEQNLNTLRKFLQWLYERSLQKPFAETAEIQPLVSFYLSHYLQRFFERANLSTGEEFIVMNANSILLEGRLKCINGETKTFMGYSDLFLIPRSDDDVTKIDGIDAETEDKGKFNYRTIKLNIGVKTPYGELFHSNGVPAKNQVQGQSIIISQLSADDRPVFSILTDLFVFSFFAYFPKERKLLFVARSHDCNKILSMYYLYLKLSCVEANVTYERLCQFGTVTPHSFEDDGAEDEEREGDGKYGGPGNAEHDPEADSKTEESKSESKNGSQIENGDGFFNEAVLKTELVFFTNNTSFSCGRDNDDDQEDNVSEISRESNNDSYYEEDEKSIFYDFAEDKSVMRRKLESVGIFSLTSSQKRSIISQEGKVETAPKVPFVGSHSENDKENVGNVFLSELKFEV
jgi:hypothetical protein